MGGDAGDEAADDDGDDHGGDDDDDDEDDDGSDSDCADTMMMSSLLSCFDFLLAQVQQHVVSTATLGLGRPGCQYDQRHHITTFVS